MPKPLKDILIAIPYVGGTVGFYFTMEAVHRLRIFWVTVVSICVYVVVRGIFPYIFRWLRQIRGYPEMQWRATKAEKKIIELEKELKECRETSAKQAGEFYELARADGIGEGRAQLHGELLSSVFSAPKMASIEEMDGEVILICGFDKESIPMKTRYFIEAANSSVIRGVVEVFDSKEENRHVYLRCVEKTSPVFWDDLLARARSANLSAPEGFHLTQYKAARLVITGHDEPKLDLN